MSMCLGSPGFAICSAPWRECRTGYGSTVCWRRRVSLLVFQACEHGLRSGPGQGHEFLSASLCTPGRSLRVP